MTDAELETLWPRITYGDPMALEIIDEWIADALRPVCLTPPVVPEPRVHAAPDTSSDDQPSTSHSMPAMNASAKRSRITSKIVIVRHP